MRRSLISINSSGNQNNRQKPNVEIEIAKNSVGAEASFTQQDQSHQAVLYQLYS